MKVFGLAWKFAAQRSQYHLIKEHTLNPHGKPYLYHLRIYGKFPNSGILGSLAVRGVLILRWYMLGLSIGFGGGP